MSDAQNTLLELLGRVRMFAGLERTSLERIAYLGEEEEHASGFIFREGDPGETFYLILTGAVRISREVAGMGEEALAILRAGDAFGEMSLVDDGPRSADARVHEPCRLYCLRKQEVQQLMSADGELANELLWNLVRLLSARLRETNNKMTFLAVSGKF